jgi:hypothetical protein
LRKIIRRSEDMIVRVRADMCSGAVLDFGAVAADSLLDNEVVEFAAYYDNPGNLDESASHRRTKQAKTTNSNAEQFLDEYS